MPKIKLDQKKLYILGAIILALIIKSFLFGDNEQELIRKKLIELSKYATFEGELNQFESLKLSKEATSFFTEDLSLFFLDSKDLREVMSSKEDIRRNYLLIRKHLSQLASKLTINNIKITNKSATVTARGRAMGRQKGRDDYFLEDHAVEIKLRKESGVWLIYRAQNTEEYDRNLKESPTSF